MGFDDEVSSAASQSSLLSELERKATPTIPVRKKRKKPSVTTVWSHSEVNELILAVEKYPCIWEYSSADYKDRNKRDQAWLKIQKRCAGHSLDDCKGKWANVKTVFQSVSKKAKRKSEPGEEPPTPNWVHWNAMQFYNRHTSTQSAPATVSTLDVQKEETPSCYSTNENFSPPEEETPEYIDVTQQQIQHLETGMDNWHIIGMYLASQMREIAKRNRRAANELHIQLVKTVIEASEQAERYNLLK